MLIKQTEEDFISNNLNGLMRNDTASHGDRKPVAAGRFYSASPKELQTELNALFNKVPDQQMFRDVRAIISPHAGYVFSGVVAAAAFASVPPEQKISNIFIIGSSHRAAFDGASIFDEGDMITPLGRVTVNLEIASALRKESEFFRHDTGVHDNEHSIEVLLPFIQYRFSNPPPVVPILIGTDNLAAIQALAASLKLWFTPDNLFIISTDFSHYPSYSDATEADRVTAEAILSGNPDELTATLQKFRKADIMGLSTNMCGWAAGLALMYLTSKENTLRYHHLMYRNSGDSQYGDKDGVVGYHSFVIADEAGSTEEMELTDDDRETLFKIARASIESGLDGGRGNRMRHAEVSARVSKPGGVFVTIYLNGELRGCIGRIVSSESICDNVAEMAFSAAFNDPRFQALTVLEYSSIEIEISVLSPLKRIYNKEEIVIGKHGVYIRKGGRSGVLLPQVASDRGWTTEQFLQHTAKYKAGIGHNGWKDAEMSVFETLILKENRSLGTVSNKH